MNRRSFFHAIAAMFVLPFVRMKKKSRPKFIVNGIDFSDHVKNITVQLQGKKTLADPEWTNIKTVTLPGIKNDEIRAEGYADEFTYVRPVFRVDHYQRKDKK